MRKLTFLVVILAVLYGGYWFVGARAIESGARGALADLQTEGWDVQFDDLQVAGFPSRFDTTLTEISLNSADNGFSWRAPFVQIFALSYQPNKIIAAFPNEFSLDLNGDSYQIENDRLRLSAAVQASSDLALSDITVEADGAKVTSRYLGDLRVTRGLGALRQASGVPHSYDIYFEATDLVQTGLVLVRGGLPDRIDRIAIDGTVALDRPLDRYAFDGSGTQPALRGVELRDMRVNIDGISLTASGDVDVDALGMPTGRVTFRTAQWRETIDLLVAVGLIEPGMQQTFTNMAQAMAASDDVLAIPISFQNGFMSIGPLPLGPAPRLR